MYKKLLISLGGVIFIALVSIVSPKTVFASTQDFVINNFDAKYVLTNQDNQGRLDVTENIDLTFADNNHGILRAVPNKYKNQSLNISNISISSPTGAAAEYTTYNDNDNTVLKIGSANRTATGKQSYIIKYTVSNVVTFYNDHDEFYWDINGDQWQQPFEKVSMSLQLPKELVLSSNQPVCYTGVFGSTASDCTIVYNNTTASINAFINKPLSASSTLSTVIGFQKNYFAPVSAKEKALNFAVIVAEAFGVPLILGGLAFSKWRSQGRDPKGRGVIVPQYDPPKGLLPAEVGAVVDFKVDQKDISATIIDLAVKRYIKIIEETVDRKILSDKTTYKFELMNEDVSSLNDYEKSLLTGLFSNTLSKGTVVDLTSLKNKFYTTVSAVKLSITKKLVTDGYFRSDPSKAGVFLWVIVAASFIGMFTLSAFFGPGFTIGIVLSLPIVAAFAFAMPARSTIGVEAKEHALGLKMYLEVAEKDRIAALQSPNAPLAENAKEPIRTVELFEKLLPYAVVFGVEKQWANEFKDIYNQPPEWYSGNASTFNTLYLANALGGGLGTGMNMAFSAPSSSGSSGFSGGGGLSGGGGGGGGGGGW